MTLTFASGPPDEPLEELRSGSVRPERAAFEVPLNSFCKEALDGVIGAFRDKIRGRHYRPCTGTGRGYHRFAGQLKLPADRFSGGQLSVRGCRHRCGAAIRDRIYHHALLYVVREENNAYCLDQNQEVEE
jgi:hypothetical protein